MSIAETVEFVSLDSWCNKAQSRAVIDALEILVAASVSTDFKYPYYWAPFVLVGNWQ